MAFILSMLSLLFLAAGLASLLFGYDLAGTDRGTALAIGGAITVSTAALLIGLAFVVSRLKRVAEALEDLQLQAVPDAAAAEAVVSGMPAPPRPVELPLPPLGPVAATLGAGAGLAAVATALADPPAPMEEPAEEAKVPAMAGEAPAAPAVTAADREPPLAVEPVAAPAMEYELIEADIIDEEVFAAPGPEISDEYAPEPVDVMPAPAAAEQPAVSPEPMRQPAEPAPLPASAAMSDPAPSTPASGARDWSRIAEAPATPLAATPEPARAPLPADTRADDPALKVIGSYSVGTSHYTMYADGSVEAQTETGIYRFTSLDELREFIEKSAAPQA